jgi:hypothetical protein
MNKREILNIRLEILRAERDKRLKLIDVEINKAEDNHEETSALRAKRIELRNLTESIKSQLILSDEELNNTEIELNWDVLHSFE